MKDGDCKMAIGAAHCVLSRKINILDQAMRVRLGSTEFVEIPPQLKNHVTHVGFCGNYMAVRSDAKDIAILILDKFPDGVVEEKAVKWKDFDSSPPPSVHAKVGGLSLTGTVRGHGCCVGRTIRFVEDSGEGGQSGTLMFNISPPDKEEPYILGVYWGCRSLGFPDMKRQGVIAKLPSLLKCSSIQRWISRCQLEIFCRSESATGRGAEEISKVSMVLNSKGATKQFMGCS